MNKVSFCCMLFGEREMKMFLAMNESGSMICAHCGRIGPVTRDHFIPKSCRMKVNEEGNLVGLCKRCNEDKADCVVTLDWYIFLNEAQRKTLDRYMRYCRSWIRAHTEDQMILEYIE